MTAVMAVDSTGSEHLPHMVAAAALARAERSAAWDRYLRSTRHLDAIGYEEREQGEWQRLQTALAAAASRLAARTAAGGSS